MRGSKLHWTDEQDIISYHRMDRKKKKKTRLEIWLVDVVFSNILIIFRANDEDERM